MSENLKLNKKDRYLEKVGDGRILIWTPRLAKRADMREFFPEFDKEGELIKRKATADKMADLEAENARLLEMLDSQTSPETVVEPTPDDAEEEPVILDELEEELIIENTGKVTRDFLETKTDDELRDYAKKVYGEKLHPLAKQKKLIDNILDLQKQMDI